MLRFVMACALVSSIFACQPAPSTSARSETEATATPATSDNAKPAQDSSKPIHLPSQNQPASGSGFKMPGVRPSEVCMEKGFTYLYQGYLKPECGTCHNKDNRYGVTQFAQGDDEASSLAVLKTLVDTKKLLEAVLGNVFCKSCVITKADPLYADLEYFVQHMDLCEKP